MGLMDEMLARGASRDGSVQQMLLALTGNPDSFDAFGKLTTSEEKLALNYAASGMEWQNTEVLESAKKKLKAALDSPVTAAQAAKAGGNGVLSKGLSAGAMETGVASAGYGMAGRVEEAMSTLPVLTEKAPSLARRAGLGVRKVAGVVGRTARRLNHPWWAMGALGAVVGVEEIAASGISGLRSGLQSDDEQMKLLQMQREYERKPWRQLLAEQEVTELVQRRLSLLQGEPALYNYVRGLPAMTAHEFLIGGKPDNQKAIDFVLLDAMKDGSVDEVMAKKSSADASQMPATGLSGLAM